MRQPAMWGRRSRAKALKNKWGGRRIAMESVAQEHLLPDLMVKLDVRVGATL